MRVPKSVKLLILLLSYSQQVIQSFIQLFNHFKTKDLNLEKLKIWKFLISNIDLLI